MLHHFLALHRHCANFRRQFARLSVAQLRHPLGYVFGKIAHPFQIVIDLECRNHKSQVGRDGLVEREHLQALFLHLDFHSIDLIVVGHDPLCQ